MASAPAITFPVILVRRASSRIGSSLCGYRGQKWAPQSSKSLKIVSYFRQPQNSVHFDGHNRQQVFQSHLLFVRHQTNSLTAKSAMHYFLSVSVVHSCSLSLFFNIVSYTHGCCCFFPNYLCTKEDQIFTKWGNDLQNSKENDAHAHTQMCYFHDRLKSSFETYKNALKNTYIDIFICIQIGPSRRTRTRTQNTPLAWENIWRLLSLMLKEHTDDT